MKSPKSGHFSIGPAVSRWPLPQSLSISSDSDSSSCASLLGGKWRPTRMYWNLSFCFAAAVVGVWFGLAQCLLVPCEPAWDSRLCSCQRPLHWLCSTLVSPGPSVSLPVPASCIVLYTQTQALWGRGCSSTWCLYSAGYQYLDIWLSPPSIAANMKFSRGMPYGPRKC